MPRGAPYGFSRALPVFTIPFPAGTGQVTSLLSFPLGFAGRVERVSIYASVAAAGAGASRTFNVRKGTASGTVVATSTVVLTDLNAPGAAPKDIPVSTVAGAADFVDADTLTIEWATAGAVAFTAGTFHVAVTIRHRAQRAA
jgi:hypothetical protein